MVKFKMLVENKETSLFLNDVDTVKVIVEGKHNISVKASADGKKYLPLAGIREQDYKLIPTITDAGSYVYDVSGFSNLQISKDALDTKVIVVGV